VILRVAKPVRVVHVLYPDVVIVGLVEADVAKIILARSRDAIV
jgi:adenylate kinase